MQRNDFRFDIRGYLQPTQRFETTIEELKDYFVDAFEESESRNEIFNQYIEFKNIFTSEITPNFVHWLDGSFVSNKNNPNDLDILVLLNSSDFITNKKLIDQKFRLQNAKIEFPLLDIYTLTIYDKNHQEYFITQADMIYWDNFWSNSKMNRAKKTFNKGYLEIKFGNILW
jgi:hypothetical protein